MSSSFQLLRISPIVYRPNEENIFVGHRRNGTGSPHKGSLVKTARSTMDCWTTARTMAPQCKSPIDKSSVTPAKPFRWSYNQGVVLGGLVELNRAAPNAAYLEAANRIAKAAIKTLADSNMVIHDFCEPNCAPDATQFKGIFIRNLQMLQRATPHAIYRKVIQSCADSIWQNDRNQKNQLSVDWAGPFHIPADASTHSSAMDALVAAIAV